MAWLCGGSGACCAEEVVDPRLLAAVEGQLAALVRLHVAAPSAQPLPPPHAWSGSSGPATAPSASAFAPAHHGATLSQVGLRATAATPATATVTASTAGFAPPPSSSTARAQPPAPAPAAAIPGGRPPGVLASAVIDASGDVVAVHCSERLSAQTTMALIPAVMRTAAAHCVPLGGRGISAVHMRGARGGGIHIYQHRGTAAVVILDGSEGSSATARPAAAGARHGAAPSLAPLVTGPVAALPPAAAATTSGSDSAALDGGAAPVMAALHAAVRELMVSLGDPRAA